jgi:hypothetical protein
MLATPRQTGSYEPLPDGGLPLWVPQGYEIRTTLCTNCMERGRCSRGGLPFMRMLEEVGAVLTAAVRRDSARSPLRRDSSACYTTLAERFTRRRGSRAGSPRHRAPRPRSTDTRNRGRGEAVGTIAR